MQTVYVRGVRVKNTAFLWAGVLSMLGMAAPSASAITSEVQEETSQPSAAVPDWGPDAQTLPLLDTVVVTPQTVSTSTDSHAGSQPILASSPVVDSNPQPSPGNQALNTLTKPQVSPLPPLSGGQSWRLADQSIPASSLESPAPSAQLLEPEEGRH